MSTSPNLRGRERGFTLLEVIVAFAILALVLGGAFAVMSGGLQAQARADEVLARLSRAQSVLATVGTERPLASARFTEGGDIIEIEVAPEGGSPATWQALGQRPYRVMVRLSAADGGGSVRLDTLRMGLPE